MALAWAGAVLVAVSARPQATYIGAERCKLCHRDVYQSWLRTPHARTETVAFDADARCHECHTTDVGERFLGVQCEACHGAGGNYWPAEVMIDPEKASMAGLVQPTEAICRRCHVNDEPNHRGDFVMPTPVEWPAAVHLRSAP